jgi:hypothetical protein
MDLNFLIQAWPIIVVIGSIIAIVVRLKAKVKEQDEVIDRHINHISKLLTSVQKMETKMEFLANVYSPSTIKQETESSVETKEATKNNTRRIERLENYVIKPHSGNN